MSITQHYYELCFPCITSFDISTPAFSSPAVSCLHFPSGKFRVPAGRLAGCVT